MLFPVLVLVLRRAVLDQLAFATDLRAHRRPRRVRAPLPTRARRRALAALPSPRTATTATTTAAARFRRRILQKRNVAVDPIAHLARAHAPKGPAAAAALQREDR